MSSVVSFAMYFDAIVTLVKVGEMEKAFAVPSPTDRRPQLVLALAFLVHLVFGAFGERRKEGENGEMPLPARS